jgi:hypothetical protein
MERVEINPFLSLQDLLSGDESIRGIIFQKLMVPCKIRARTEWTVFAFRSGHSNRLRNLQLPCLAWFPQLELP